MITHASGLCTRDQRVDEARSGYTVKRVHAYFTLDRLAAGSLLNYCNHTCKNGRYKFILSKVNTIQIVTNRVTNQRTDKWKLFGLLRNAILR